MSREAKILSAILVVVVGGMIALFSLSNKSTPAPVGDKKVIRDTSHKEGTGSVQLVEFGDYECPACGAAYPNVQQILKDFNGKVTFYFRNFPLTQIHPNAQISAEAAEAAGDQGKFWEMHNMLYANQKDWSTDADPNNKLVAYAKSLGLDTTKFQNVIDQDEADGTALNIQATPTFYINGTQFQGNYDYASLRDAITAVLPKS